MTAVQMPVAPRRAPQAGPRGGWRPLGKADIEALLGTRPVARTEHFVLHCLLPSMVVIDLYTDTAPERDGSVEKSDEPTPAPHPGLATLIPKRHANRAVTRNLIRRQMREVLRQEEPAARSGKLLLRLKAPFDSTRYRAAASTALRAAVRQELKDLLAQRGAKPCH
jgi:ribonuclease P protein component